MASGYEQKIWNYFKEKIGNDFGVAGLMGNLQAESGLYPDRVQGDIPYSSYSKEYTEKVDSGIISEYDFVHNGPNGGGYGLAQWTYYTRKQALYDMYQTGYDSIGSIDLALDYLWKELQQDFSGVVKVLKAASSVREASNKVLHDFEQPGDQSTQVEEEREQMGLAFYRTYAGTSGEDYTDEINAAINWAVGIANDDSHGYDQEDRWGLDYDCSSLVIQAFENAGVPVKTNGATYTGNMISVFEKTGFTKLTYSSGMELIRGDVLWRTGHTEIYIGNGQRVGARINEFGEVTGGQVGDQTGNEISVKDYSSSESWEYVLRLPSGTFVDPDIPVDPDLPNFTFPKRKFNFILFSAKRRMKK